MVPCAVAGASSHTGMCMPASSLYQQTPAGETGHPSIAKDEPDNMCMCLKCTTDAIIMPGFKILGQNPVL